MEQLPIPKQDSHEELADRWAIDYDRILDVLLDKKSVTLEEVANVVWEKGILDHVVSIDPKVRKACQDLKRFILDLDRENPELYWRILYGAGSISEAQKHSYSLIPDKIAASAIQTAWLKLIENKINLSSDLSELKNEEVYHLLSELIMEKARERLRILGSVPHDQLIPWGAEGVYKNIPVIIERYWNGLVVLGTKNYQDAKKLIEILDGTSVSPAELRPENFRQPEKL